VTAPACPVCDGRDVVDLVARDRLPVMQNVVWPSREEALAAPCAPFSLGLCRACGFAFNTRFDGALMVYDPRYDNDVPSAVFTDYYRSIARDLAARHDLTRGPVYDVGCGKGTFLDVLCATVPGTRGVGVDPSCTPREADTARPVALLREMFRAELVAERPSLVVCRHVIEHIARPVEFIRAVVEGIRRDPAVPLFFEVPDLDWIIEHEAFWDFCYEHCNYFTRASFAHALERGGVAVASSRGDAAHSAVADGPRAGLRPLKWEPGTERPVCTGLPGGAPVAGATVGRSPTAAVELHATLGGLSCCSA
jgi:SAM-dependent methyltransferase